jgi:hypothetical protein
MRVGQIFVQGRGLMDVWINGETENEFHVVTFEAVLVAGVMVPVFSGWVRKEDVQNVTRIA